MQSRREVKPLWLQPLRLSREGVCSCRLHRPWWLGPSREWEGKDWDQAASPLLFTPRSGPMEPLSKPEPHPGPWHSGRRTGRQAHCLHLHSRNFTDFRKGPGELLHSLYCFLRIPGPCVEPAWSLNSVRSTEQP